MLPRILAALLFLCVSPVFAQAAPTCVAGATGVAPTASLKFVPPLLNTDGTTITNTPLTYNLYQSTATGTETKVASGITGSPVAVTTGLTSSSTVYWKISVVDSKGIESALSPEVCKTFPASVPGSIIITIS